MTGLSDMSALSRLLGRKATTLFYLGEEEALLVFEDGRALHFRLNCEEMSTWAVIETYPVPPAA